MQANHEVILDPFDRPIWGVKAIAKAIDTDELKCWHLIRIGQLPVNRAGNRGFKTLPLCSPTVQVRLLQPGNVVSAPAEESMRARASREGVTLRVIAGSNNALLAMDLTDDLRKECLGFTIERTDLDTEERRWLPNMLRFKSDTLEDPRASQDLQQRDERKDDDVPSVSSARAPFQTFRWGDYTLEPGKSYRYRLIARSGTAATILEKGKQADDRREFDSIEGGVSVEVKTENNRDSDVAVFFNRGAAASKAYNERYGNNDPSTIPDALWWLSRGLEEALIKFIGRAADSEFALHGAVYEFQKPELLRALQDAHDKRHVAVTVVYHGRATKRDQEGIADAKEAAAKNEKAIRDAGLTFELKPRKADPQDAIMHNKFIVLLRKGGDGSLKPIAVWTGSTNWTEGAIVGQLNVGHEVFDKEIAQKYEAYFQLLYADLPAATIKEKTVQLTPVPRDRASISPGITPIFSPQGELDMIKLYADVCGTAKLLMVCAPFLLHEMIRETFKRPSDGAARFLMADKKGVFGKDNKDGGIELLEHDPGNEVSVATLLKSPLHDFQGNLLQDKESFHHAGVHIHSKIILADPFSNDPVLITGSANFSNNSTLVNDSNSLIIRGDTAVADIYATEFMRMFEHYWFRAHMQGKTKGGGAKKTREDLVLCLSEDSSWSDPHYQPGTRQMIERLAFAGL